MTKVIPVFKTGDFLIKSLRYDQFCFIDDFLEGITRTKDQPKPNSPRSWQGHKIFTVYANHIAIRAFKISPYPEEELYKKEFTSPHQSTTLIPYETTPPVFGLFKDRSNALVGIITDPKDALFNRFFLKDAGTVVRPYECNSFKEAKDYQRRHMDTLFDSYEVFKKTLKEKIALSQVNSHNEVLARIRWNPKSNAIGIFSDNDESRFIAQIYAQKLKALLASKAGKLPEAWNPDYTVPVYYYIPGSRKHLKEYTAEEMAADEIRANKILACGQSRDKAFNDGCFSYLLLARNPIFALAIEWCDKPILIELIRLNLYHIAKHLVERAGFHNISIYLQINNLVSQAYTVCSWESQTTTDLIRTHRIDLLKIIATIADPSRINFPNLEGDPPLVLAAYYGHAEIVSFLLEKGAQRDTCRNRDGDTALICAVREGHIIGIMGCSKYFLMARQVSGLISSAIFFMKRLSERMNGVISEYFSKNELSLFAMSATVNEELVSAAFNSASNSCIGFGAKAVFNCSRMALVLCCSSGINFIRLISSSSDTL